MRSTLSPQVMRTVPAGLSRSAVSASSSASISSKRWPIACARRSPAAVGATLRVVRVRRRICSRSSSPRTGLAQRRLRDPQRGGGAGKAAFARHGHEGEQIVEVASCHLPTAFISHSNRPDKHSSPSQWLQTVAKLRPSQGDSIARNPHESGWRRRHRSLPDQYLHPSEDSNEEYVADRGRLSRPRELPVHRRRRLRPMRRRTRRQRAQESSVPERRPRARGLPSSSPDECASIPSGPPTPTSTPRVRW